MPEMIRNWVIPTSGTSTDLTIELCEPPLTGDSLGLKTWGTSFVMAKKLEELGDQYFGHLLSNRSTEEEVVTLKDGPMVESKLTVKIELTMESDEVMKSNTTMNYNATIRGETMVVSGSTLENNLIHPGRPAGGTIHNEGRILELGSGTGLLGLTAAMLWNKPTVLTDLPDIVPNLDVNLKRNGFGQTSESMASAEVLDWSDAEGSVVFSQDPNNKFEVW